MKKVLLCFCFGMLLAPSDNVAADSHLSNHHQQPQVSNGQISKIMKKRGDIPIANATAKKEKKITGKASWYGPNLYWQETASGKVYHPKDVFAAHRDLPFGTKIKVKNLENNRSIVVAVLDRGPYVEGGEIRVVDLTRKAAEKLGMLKDGVVPVEITIL